VNWDQIKGNWTQLRGKIREEWGDLTDDDFDKIAGERDQLIGKIEEKYGRTREDASEAADRWADMMEDEGASRPVIQR